MTQASCGGVHEQSVIAIMSAANGSVTLRGARALDPAWRRFIAQTTRRAGTIVVPIWSDGAKARNMQRSSHLNTTLRMALLIREFKTRVNRPVRLGIGVPINSEIPLLWHPERNDGFLGRRDLWNGGQPRGCNTDRI